MNVVKEIKLKKENKIINSQIETKMKRNKKREYLIRNKNFIKFNKLEIQKTHEKFNIKTKSFFVLMKILIISFINISCFLDEHNKRNIFLKSSEINLKVKGEDNVLILSPNFFHIFTPNEIYINNEDTPHESNYEYNLVYLNLDIINIKIKWDISITNTSYMFERCSQIVEMDLSGFDTSLVTEMSVCFIGAHQ